MTHVYRRELPEMLENEVVLKIAQKHGKTPGQVLLRFAVQQGIAIIPKSTNLQRMEKNIQVNNIYDEKLLDFIIRFLVCGHLLQIFDFDMDADDMEALKAQDAGEGGRIIRFQIFQA